MLFVERPITANHIRAFCEKFREGLRVEYKANLDASVREKIVKVVSSFANSQGGVLVIGVTAVNGEPRAPFDGFVEPEREELALTIENLCLSGIYPLLLPDNITLVRSDIPGRVFLVIEVGESSRAPHAVENSHKVYVRTGDASNPYDLAKIDSILDLMKRRTDPLALRNKLISGATERANDPASGSPIVTVMQPTESLLRLGSTRSYRARSVVRCSLPESQMRAILMVITNIFRKQPFQMQFVHHTIMWSNRSRRQLSTHRSATPFCQGLLNEVRRGCIFKDRTATGTSIPYFPSRSKIRNRGADS